jgi:hypothetical protein
MPFKNIEDRREYANRWSKENRHRTRRYAKQQYDKNRLFLRELKKGMTCTQCPENHWACLDFHHPNDNKERGVAQLVGGGYSKERIFLEIAKCVVLCSNCHRKIHAS